MIYAGLDYGSKRIGLALSDELERFAEPAGFLENSGDDKTWKKLAQFIADSRAAAVVVGIPTRTSGEPNVEAKTVMKFVDQLKAKTSCSIITWDERFTTKQAERLLSDEAALSERKMREKKDAVAAALMLQNYLDFKRLRGSHVQDIKT